MPLDTIYLVRHAHRLNWTIDYKTGEYKSQFPTPTGNPADPTLTSHGVRQANELAAHVLREEFMPKPFRIYCSPFYRCLQTIQPCAEALKEVQKRRRDDIDACAEFDVRIENGLGEWFGSTTFFDHPPPASPDILRLHFPSIITPVGHTSSADGKCNYTYTPQLVPSTRGETIAQLHNRVATVLEAIIAEVDAEVAAVEEAASDAAQDKGDSPHNTPVRKSKAILICSHAAPLIAMGRALTGNMPSDSSQEDFHVFTTGLSTFVRRRAGKGVEEGAKQPTSSSGTSSRTSNAGGGRDDLLAPGTTAPRSPSTLSIVPDWKDGKGVGGGWDCVVNGDCSFLSGGAERGWHFNGEESFDTGPMAASSSTPSVSDGLMSTSSQEVSTSNARTKL